MNRRELLKNIATGTATLFIVPAVVTSCEDETVDPDANGPDPNVLTIDLNEEKYSNLGNAGGFVIESSIIVFNTGNGFTALSSVCTHNNCTISYDHGSGNLPCPCHGSVFSTSGSVLNGPAETSLKKYEIEQEGDILTIPL